MIIVNSINLTVADVDLKLVGLVSILYAVYTAICSKEPLKRDAEIPQLTKRLLCRGHGVRGGRHPASRKFLPRKLLPFPFPSFRQHVCFLYRKLPIQVYTWTYVSQQKASANAMETTKDKLFTKISNGAVRCDVVIH